MSEKNNNKKITIIKIIAIIITIIKTIITIDRNKFHKIKFNFYSTL